MLEASRRQDRRRGLERLGRSCAGHVAPERAHPRRHAPRVYLAVALIAEHPPVHRMISELIDRVASGDLHVAIDRSFPLSEAAAAHAYPEGRNAFGRLVTAP